MSTTHIQLKKHRSAKSIVLAWCRWSHPKMSEEKLLKTDMELIIQIEGKKYKSANAQEFIKHIQRLKVWGFCEHKCDCTKIIHIWFTKEVKYEKLIEVVTHELEHATGTKSEKRCCKTGGLAGYASLLIQNDLKFKRKNRTK